MLLQPKMAQPLSAVGKKRMEEKNGKLIKDLSLLPGNRNCAECGMRGPTYADTTVDSFCCSTCAGVLRGLNPPHRIKSISMATFSNEEVEKLRAGGNEDNHKTWMGMYSGCGERNFASKEDRQNFIADKYERKKYYVSPEQVQQQRAILEGMRDAQSEQLKVAPTRPELDIFSSLSLGASSGPPSVSLDSVFSPPGARFSSVEQPQPISPPAFHAPPPPLPKTIQPPPQQSLPFSPPAAAVVQNTFTSYSVPHHLPFPQLNAPRVVADPFGDSFTASFKPAPPATAPVPKDPFADFEVKFDDDSAFSSLSIKGSTSMDVFNSRAPASAIPKSQTSSLVPSDPFGADPFGAFAVAPQPPVTAPSPAVPSPPKPPLVAASEADKYSALAELDDLFHSTPADKSSSTGKPSWISSGFSAPPPPSSSPFSTGHNGVTKSSTAGALSFIPDPLAQFARSQSSLSGAPASSMFQQPMGYGTTGGPAASAYAHSAAVTGNPFALPTQPHPAVPFFGGVNSNPPATAPGLSNPFWNPFLS